jgi:hypothetical protein
MKKLGAKNVPELVRMTSKLVADPKLSVTV